MLLAGSSVVSVVSVNTNNSVELPTLTYSTEKGPPTLTFVFKLSGLLLVF